MKPALVFLSPVAPKFSGNGLMMRAAHNLRALSERFTVHLLIISLYDGKQDVPSAEILSFCESWKHISTKPPAKRKSIVSARDWIIWKKTNLPPEYARWTLSMGRKIHAYLNEIGCKRIWMFRFALLPWVRTLLNNGFKVWLDLDELESANRELLSALYLKLGWNQDGRQLLKEAETYRALEKRFLPRFELIVTASDIESNRLKRDLGKSWIETWPNIISPPPSGIDKEDKRHDKWRILFIGSMGHFPNRDAVRHAANEVMPRLPKLIASRPIVLQVAGSLAETYRIGVSRLNCVEWLGTVENLGPLYAEADIVIVPLRSGGGTRIKILEAFVHRKAVVSTRIGAEGLDVLHGRELLLADEPDGMAKACAELLIDKEKRIRLAEAGYAYVTANHGEDNLKKKVEALAETVLLNT